MNEIENLKNAIKTAYKIVFFTGAGISTESGILDFKTVYNSKFEGYDCEEILDASFFEDHPNVFLRFIKNYLYHPYAKPNKIHYFITNLQKHKNVTVITQNIDGLHQQANTSKVIELHGNLKNWHCQKCRNTKNIDEMMEREKISCTTENCSGKMKPDIALYGEEISQSKINKCLVEISSADVLIVAGTRLQTVLSHELVKTFKKENLFVINKEPVDLNRPYFFIQNDIGKIVDELNSPKTNFQNKEL